MINDYAVKSVLMNCAKFFLSCYGRVRAQHRIPSGPEGGPHEAVQAPGKLPLENT